MEIISVADSDIQSAQLTKLNRINFEECLESLRIWISNAWTFWVIQDYGNSSSFLYNILQQISFGHMSVVWNMLIDITLKIKEFLCRWIVQQKQNIQYFLVKICWLIWLWNSKNFFVLNCPTTKRSTTISIKIDFQLTNNFQLNQQMFFLFWFLCTIDHITVTLSFFFLWSTGRALIS